MATTQGPCGIVRSMKKLEYSMSARRDARTYLVLLVSLGFLFAGATVNPDSNCDASGRDCAPWLIPVALWMGGVGTAMGLGYLAFNRKWGSRLDMAQRRLVWWDSLVPPTRTALHLMTSPGSGCSGTMKAVTWFSCTTVGTS